MCKYKHAWVDDILRVILKVPSAPFFGNQVIKFCAVKEYQCCCINVAVLCE